METLLLLGAVFFGISALFSMIGMGGGMLYVPLLLLAGFSIKQAPALSLILITATSLAALSTFWRSRKVDWKLAMVIDPPTDVMAFVGGFFSSLLPEDLLKALLVIILMLAGTLMLKESRPAGRRGVPESGRWRWHRDFHGTKYTVNLPLVLTATAFIGLLSGMLGITGGIIKLPIMVLLCGVPMDIAVATSTVMVAVTALSGLAGHALNGQVEWRTGLILAGVAVAGGLLGSKTSLAMDKTRLKKVFGLIVWLMAIYIGTRLIFR